MFSSQSAQSQTPRPWRIGVAGTCLASLLLVAQASAQSGSVQFKVESFQPVPASAVATEYPDFKSLHLMPFYPTSPGSGHVDMLIVQRFNSVFLGDPDAADDDDSSQQAVIIAEYDAYDQGADRMRESGLLAFTLAEQALASASGDNIIGFIRQPSGTVPSRLTGDGSDTSTPASGYLTNLAGDVYWDFKSVSRRGYMIGTGATYNPTFEHENYLNISTSGNNAGFTALVLPVAGTEHLDWTLSTPLLRPLRNRTGVDQTLYYGIIDRIDAITSEDLGLDTPETADDLVEASLGAPWQFHNQIYVMRLLNITDSDGDRVPDFLDLTNTIVKMPTIADWGTGESWYFAGMTGEWIYSTLSTQWDYSNKFGWNWPYQPSPRSNYWFYVAGQGMGWMWTSDQHFPIMYRHADGTFLKWISTTDRTSTYYNFSSRAFETTSF